MPRLWTQTITEHRNAVRQAVLEATAALVTEHGLRAVTMSQVAEATGIGRATLYKYFSDVDAILLAWHERHIAAHLQQLADVRDRTRGGPRARLQAVLTTYALVAREPDDAVAAALHAGPHMGHAHQHLHELVRELIADGAASGELRDDVAADELTKYCLHALGAARGATSEAAVRRLAGVVLAGMERR